MKSEYVLERDTSCTSAARADVADCPHSAQPPRLPFLPLQQAAGLVEPVALLRELYADAAGPSYVAGAD